MSKLDGPFQVWALVMTGEHREPDFSDRGDTMDVFAVKPIAAGPVNMDDVHLAQAFYATEAEALAVAQVRNFRSECYRAFHSPPDLYAEPFAWFVVLIAGTGEYRAIGFRGGESLWWDEDFITGIFPDEASAKAYAENLVSRKA